MTARPSAALAAVPLLLSTGCVAEAPADDAADDADVVVVAEDLVYEPDRIEIVAGRTATLHLTNVGGITHDLVLEDGWRSGNVRPGDAVTLELGPLHASTVAWCSLPGHRDAGMELEVTVVAEGTGP